MATPALTTIDIAGFRGSYTDEGVGLPIVILASPFARAAIYRPTAEALLAFGTFRVIVVEMPGSGVGSRVSKWGFADYATWVAQLHKRLALDDVILIGHSHSGAVAMIVASTDAARHLAATVLVDPVGAEASRSFLGVFVGCAICLPLELRFALRVIPAAAGNVWRHGRNFLRQFILSVRADLSDVARRVRVPALLVWGAMDYVEPLPCATQFMRWLPRAQLYISRQGSHDWLVTRPSEFAQAVARWKQDAITPSDDSRTLVADKTIAPTGFRSS